MAKKNGTTETTFPAIFVVDQIRPLENVMSVSWSDKARGAVSELKELALKTNKVEAKHLPTASLRALMEATVPGIWYIDPTMGFYGQDKPFLKVVGEDLEPIRVALDRAIAVWINTQLSEWFDFLEPTETEEDKALAQEELDSFLGLLTGRQAYDINPDTHQVDEPDQDVVGQDFTQARDALIPALAQTLSGVELFDGMGPVRRVVQAGKTPLNILEFETWPQRHGKACYSMVCRLSVETLPGLNKLVLIPRVRRRLWRSKVPDGAALFGQKALTTRILTKDNPKVSITSRLSVKAGKVASNFNPLFSMERLKAEDDLSGDVSEQMAATEYANRGVFVAIPHSPKYGRHSIGFGASTRDHVDVFEKLSTLLEPLGIIPAPFDTTKTTYSVSDGWNDRQLSIEELFIPWAEDLDAMDDLEIALEMFTQEFDLNSGLIDPEKKKELEKHRESQRKKASYNSDRVEKVFGNKRPVVAIVAATEKERRLIRLAIEHLFGNGVICSDREFALPPKTHGPREALHDGKPKTRDRYKVQYERWKELAKALKEAAVTHVIVQAPQFFENRTDDEVNKLAARACLAGNADVNVQYLRPFDDFSPLDRAKNARKKAPSPGFSDYLYRLQSAVYDLLLGHSAAIDPYKNTMDIAFPDKATSPDAILSYAIISKRKGKRGQQGGELAICLRIREFERRAEACMATLHPDGHTQISPWSPFSDFLKKLAENPDLSLGDSKERKSVFQEFVKATVDDTLDVCKRPLLFFDASQTRQLWPAIKNNAQMPPAFTFDGTIADLPIGMGKYKDVRIIRLDRDQAGHIVTKISSRDEISGQEIRGDSIKVGVVQLSTWENGGLFWDTPGYNFQEKRGLSVYRDMLVKKSGKSDDGETTETRTFQKSKPYPLPSVLEISIIRSLDGDNLHEICAAIHKLRLLASHHTATAAMPAPLSFTNKVEDYLSRFDFDTDDEDEEGPTEANLPEAEPSDEEIADAVADLEETVNPDGLPELDPDDDPNRSRDAANEEENDHEPDGGEPTVDTTEEQHMQAFETANDVAIRKKDDIKRDLHEKASILAQNALRLAEMDPTTEASERIARIANEIRILTEEYQNAQDPEVDLTDLVSELKGILEEMSKEFKDEFDEFGSSLLCRIENLAEATDTETYEAARVAKNAARSKADEAILEINTAQNLLEDRQLARATTLIQNASQLRIEVQTLLHETVLILEKTGSRENAEQPDEQFPNTIQFAVEHPQPLDRANPPEEREPEISEDSRETDGINGEAEHAATPEIVNEPARGDLPVENEDFEDPFETPLEESTHEDAPDEEEILDTPIPSEDSIDHEADIERDIETIETIKLRISELVANRDYSQAYHLRKSADRKYGPENFSVTFTTAELFLIAGNGQIDQGAFTGAEDDAGPGKRTLFVQAVETAHDLVANSRSTGINAARRYFLFAAIIESALFDKDFDNNAISVVTELFKNGAGTAFYDLANIATDLKTQHRTPSRSEIYSVHATIDESIPENAQISARQRLEVFHKSKWNFKPAQNVRDHLFHRGEGILFQLGEAISKGNFKAAMKYAMQFESHEAIEELVEEARKKLRLQPIKYGALSKIRSGLTSIHADVKEWYENRVAIDEHKRDDVFLSKLSNQLSTALDKTTDQLELRRTTAGTDVEMAAVQYGLEIVSNIREIVTGKRKPETNSARQQVALHDALFFIPGLTYAGGWEATPYRHERILQAILDDEIPSADQRRDPSELIKAARERAEEGSFRGGGLLLETARLLGLGQEELRDEFLWLENNFRTEWENVRNKAKYLKYRVVLVQRFAPDDNSDFDEESVTIIDNSVDDLLRIVETDSPPPLLTLDEMRSDEDKVERLNDILALKLRLGEIETRLDNIIETPREKLRERALEAFGHDKASNVERHRLDGINKLLDQGDLSTAQELFETDGEALEAEGIVRPKHFNAFFPAIQNDINEKSPEIPEVRLAIQEGIDLGSLKFSTVEDRALAEGVLEAWAQLRHSIKKPKEQEIQARVKALLRASILDYSEPKEQIQTRGLSRLHGTRRRHVFDATIPGIFGGANNILLPDFGSIVKGNWRICVCEKTPTDDELIELTGVAETTGVLIFVLGRMTSEERNAIYHFCLREKRRAIVIDETLMLYALAQNRFRFMSMLEVAQAFTYAHPFRDHGNKGVPPEMFVGRNEERQQILSPHGSFLMFGGRRLGKTALLHFVAEQQNHEHGIVAAYISMHSTETQNLWEKASKAMPKEIFLDPVTTSDKFSRSITNWLKADSRRRILLLVDESNDFIKDDQKENFKTLMSIIDLMNSTDRRFKCVFAGLQNIARAVHNVENSPISHLERNVLAIGPLTGSERKDAETLVTKALAGMGYQFKHRHDVWRILNFCLYYPVLIQLFCQVLVEQLVKRGTKNADVSDPINREIGTELVEEMLRDPKTLDRIRQAFDWTLALDGERYRLLALIIAQQAIENSTENRPNLGMTPRELLLAAGEYWPQTFGHGHFTDSDMGAMVVEMENLGVLKSIGSNRWTLRSRSLQTMLGDQERILEDLMSFIDKPRPPTFDVKLRRRLFDSPPPNRRRLRSPLTTGDLNRILSSGPKVSVITGLEVAGIAYVHKAIEDVVTHEYPESDINVRLFKGRSANDLGTFLRDLTRKKMTLIVRSEQWNPEWIRVALGRKAVIADETRVVFILDKNNAKLWAGSEKMMSEDLIGHYPLYPWRQLETDTFLHQTHNTEIKTDDIYQACGGWNLPMSTLFPDSSGNALTFRKALGEARKEAMSWSLEDYGIDEKTSLILREVFELTGCTASDSYFDVESIEIASLDHPELKINSKQLVAYLKALGVAEPSIFEGGTERYRLNPHIAERLLSSGAGA
ncbi:DUF3893 domain-containing protein [Rhodobacterales bacterium]|nr:DUF3893 domain-containing protein [Rhodobacterales bacterium]